MATPLEPRPYLAIHLVTVAPDGLRDLHVRVATRTSGVVVKRLNAGESHQPLLPWLESAQLQLPHSFQSYRLAWGVGAGEHATALVFGHDPLADGGSFDDEHGYSGPVGGVRDDVLLGADYETLWGSDGGPDFIDHAGQPVPRDQVNLVGVYPNLLTAENRGKVVK
ncbi:hypothetical protein [Protaetiibacter larvae]|uniref:Uncharacterized protein n=1 Tax=Protaetiibacter larvae TaxID=2592654 RepID=A0A5C1Y9R5_9MICO|nr:hypothetical protein [Protaetiibacter larvae]QEO10556.1 hypothetical protein FLP23_11425 [Protaetiibacter larvae]